jgi:hypothetical protein
MIALDVCDHVCEECAASFEKCVFTSVGMSLKNIINTVPLSMKLRTHSQKQRAVVQDVKL